MFGDRVFKMEDFCKKMKDEILSFAYFALCGGAALKEVLKQVIYFFCFVFFCFWGDSFLFGSDRAVCRDLHRGRCGLLFPVGLCL